MKMPEQLKKRTARVVGVRQVLRALGDQSLEKVYLALDAAPHLRGQVEAAAQAAGIPVETVATMEELARLCRVDVPSAAAGCLRAPAQNTGK
ncbi:MAG: 50S ribosomal protein L7ae-like protein [Clostridiales bacterium]|nr:50S ribosomal protein L7ae-like protein [Clostridiales bacterium]